LRSTGFTLLEHLHFDEIVPNLSSVLADRCMARIRDCARANFT
jgi:NAD(P)H dehydrogenase (quinone)